MDKLLISMSGPNAFSTVVISLANITALINSARGIVNFVIVEALFFEATNRA